MIIDIYNHILTKKYQETIDQKIKGRDNKLSSVRYAGTVTPLMDMDARFRIPDEWSC